MTSETDEEKLPLIWPELHTIEEIPINEPVIERIELKLNEQCIDSLLSEIELEFPHVAERLSLLLGTKEFEMALSQYIIDHRGNRTGFPKHTMNCLLKLHNCHIEKYGILMPEETHGMYNLR